MERILIWIVGLGLILGCEPDLSDDPIPYQPFDVININLNLPEYIKLKMDGGYEYLDDGGYKGLLIYRQNALNYYTYDRYCSFQPNSACATVDVDITAPFYIRCTCCGSHFDFVSGLPIGGPAWRPLRQYETSLNGTQLVITDRIIE